MGPRKNPNTCQKLSENDSKLLKKLIKNYDVEMVQVGPNKFFMKGKFPDYSDDIYNFEVKGSDVWVVTLPRSGTTLTQEMVWQICNDLDFDGAVPLVERFPYFEFPLFVSQEDLLKTHKNDPEMCQKIKQLTTLPWKKQYAESKRRFFKSHFPLSLLPKELLTSNSKIIYVARCLHDLLVSNFHHHRMIGKPVPETLEDFWVLAEKGLILGFPYFSHIQEAWDLKDQGNLLFLFYEDIVKKPEETIEKVAQFMGKTLTQKQKNQLLEHLKFENFKSNESVNKDYSDIFGWKNNNHVRKGKIGAWKEEFTEELKQKVDDFIADNYKTTDLRFT